MGAASTIPFKSSPPSVRQEIIAFLQLAIPLAGAQVAQAMTGFVDTVMMGWLGQITLAAGGLAVMIFTSFLFVGIAIVSSVSPLVAAAQGAGQPHRVGLITHQGLWVALGFAGLSWPAIAQLDGFMLAVGQDPGAVALADQYLDLARWGLLPALLFAVLRYTVTALSHARPILVIVVVANLLNMGGNYILAFGKWGFPALGIQGLALASNLAHLTMCVALGVYVLWNLRAGGCFQGYGLGQGWYRCDLSTLLRVLGLGIPMGLSTILEHGLFTVLTFMMGALGTATLAASQLALQTVVVIFMVPLAMSQAATVRVGQWFGQGNWAGVRQAAAVSLAMTVGFMALAGIGLFLGARPLMGLYLDWRDPANQAVFDLGAVLLAVAGAGQILDGAQRTANGVLQGLQDTRTPLLVSIVAFWVMGLSTSYVLGFHTPLAGVGIWIGSYVGLACGSVGFLGRFWYLLRRGERRALAG